MKRRVLLSIGLVAVIVLVFGWRNSDRLPPRRPYKIARVVSEVPVPKDARVLEFRDQWSGNGDGQVRIVLQLTAVQFAELMRALDARGYRVPDPAGTNDRLIQSLIGSPVRGPYRFSGSIEDGYELVLFEPETQRMYVLLSVQ